MSIALWALASALILLVLLAGLVLMTPVKLAITLETSTKWRLEATLCLIDGLMPAISVPASHNDRRKNRPSKPRRARKARKRASRRSSARILRAISAMPRLLVGLLRRIHFDRLSVDADVGLGDPADTGQFFGLMIAATHAVPSKQNVSIVIRPDFAEPRASGRLDAELSFVPLALIAPSVRFAWHILGSRR